MSISYRNRRRAAVPAATYQRAGQPATKLRRQTKPKQAPKAKLEQAPKEDPRRQAGMQLAAMLVAVDAQLSTDGLPYRRHLVEVAHQLEGFEVPAKATKAELYAAILEHLVNAQPA